jgi:ribosome-associated heat shock protein Hsp15
MEATRVDRYLWAVRLYKTRTLATDACHAGHVRVNGSPAKAGARVKVGDRIEARVAHRLHVLEVVEVIDKRVSATIAATCFVDHSPPPPPRELATEVLMRDPGAGRPTKRDRRAIDRHRGR